MREKFINVELNLILVFTDVGPLSPIPPQLWDDVFAREARHEPVDRQPEPMNGQAEPVSAREVADANMGPNDDQDFPQPADEGSVRFTALNSYHLAYLPRHRTLEAAPRPNQPYVPQLDDIKVQYHRSSHRPTQIYAFEDYKQEKRKVDPHVFSKQPWLPFNTRTEFDFAELAHEAHLSKGHIARMLDIIAAASSHPESFTFKTPADVDRAWKRAEQQYPTVCYLLSSP